MNTRILNLALMFVWLLICIGLLTRDLWMPADLHEKVSGPQTSLVIAVTAVLAVWNLMRFLVAPRFTAKPQPSAELEEYRRRIRSRFGNDPKVTDPQFNFDDPAHDDQSRHGDR